MDFLSFDLLFIWQVRKSITAGYLTLFCLTQRFLTRSSCSLLLSPLREMPGSRETKIKAQIAFILYHTQYIPSLLITLIMLLLLMDTWHLIQLPTSHKVKPCCRFKLYLAVLDTAYFYQCTILSAEPKGLLITPAIFLIT